MTVIHLYKTSVPVSRSFSHPTSWANTLWQEPRCQTPCLWQIYENCKEYSLLTASNSWCIYVMTLPSLISMILLQFIKNFNICLYAESRDDNAKISLPRPPARLQVRLVVVKTYKECWNNVIISMQTQKTSLHLLLSNDFCQNLNLYHQTG